MTSTTQVNRSMGIRQLYSSLRRLAPAYYTDESLKDIGRKGNGVLTYLINGRR